jgi:manganese transport protein
LIETFLDRPNWTILAYHSVVPAIQGPESVLLATGILGATVMPHVIFLHSALTQGRIVTRQPDELRRLYRFECLDVTLAMGVAGLVNMAMLIMAAATFHQRGLTSVGTIEEAYKTLTPLLGGAASWVFAISLLASGLSSSTVGTMAGQVVMQGCIHRQTPVWVRRLLTMVPAMVVIGLGLDPTRTLVLSQVVLSFGLPFALVPPVRFTARPNLMGVLVNRRGTTALAWLVTGAIVALNVFLLYQLIWGG